MWPGSRLKALTPSLIEWQHKRNCLFWPNNCGTPVIQAHYQTKPVLFPLSINNSHLHLSRWDKMSWARKHCDKSLKSGQVLEVSVKETRRQCRFPVCDQSCSSNLILLRPVCFTSHAEPRLRCFVDDIVLHILKSWQQSAWQWKLWMHHNYPAPAIWDALHSVNERTFSFMYFFFLGMQSKGNCQQVCKSKGTSSCNLIVIHSVYSYWKFNYTSISKTFQASWLS